MTRLMRCKYCGTLQDEPQGSKICAQCGGELFYAAGPWVEQGEGYLQAQVELDQIAAPAGQAVERHLVVTVKTPHELPPVEKAQTGSGREALHFVAVLDTSGSMRGSKMTSARAAVLQAVQRLHEGDLFSLVTFATDVRCPLASRRVNAHMRQVIASAVNEIDAGGQTALCGGLEEGIAQAVEASCKTNLVLVVSDGQANVGETDVEAVGRRALDGRLQGVTVSALGIGLDYNEALMAEIALDGGGRFYHVERDQQLVAYLAGELGEVASLAARDVSVTLDLSVNSTLNALSAAYLVQGNSVTLGDIPLATTLEVILKVELPPQSAGVRLPIDSTLHYLSPRGRVFQVALNRVTIRYDPKGDFSASAGAVKPVVRRVIGQMQAAGVLATSKAATRGRQAARQESRTQIQALQSYAALLGKDEESGELVSESEHLLDDLLAPEPAKSKAATYEAMRVQRGSKNFGPV